LIWKHDLVGVYHILMMTDELANDIHWKVPLMVSLFAWRTINKRIHTKGNLRCIGVGGWGQEETINHLFLECDLFGRIWHLVRRWLGISIVLSDIVFHSQQFFGAHAFKKKNWFLFRGWLVGMYLGHLERTEFENF